MELMPAPPSLRPAGNPWPQWPLVFRTSSSQEEGGAREFARLTKKLTGSGGRLTALHSVQVELKKDATGKVTLVEVPDSEQIHQVELLILAMGFSGPETDSVTSQLGVALDARGNIQADRRAFATSVPGVFCAGDAGRGASLIVWAIAEGREAARSVDAYLRRQESVLPTRGTDSAFGGR
jgi:glutamate synthase (NADPH/NADH) small chain